MHALMTVDVLILLFQSNVPASCLLPVQDVVVTTPSSRGDIKSTEIQVTADTDAKNLSLEGDVQIPAMFMQNEGDPTTEEYQVIKILDEGVTISLSTSRTLVPNTENSLPRQSVDEPLAVTGQGGDEPPL